MSNRTLVNRKLPNGGSIEIDSYMSVYIQDSSETTIRFIDLSDLEIVRDVVNAAIVLRKAVSP